MASDIKNVESIAGSLVPREVTSPRPQGASSVPREDGGARPSSPAPQGKEGLERLAERLRDYVQSMDREVQFSVDEASGYTVIKVIDPENQKVIRQIPAEVTLRLATRLGHTAQGLLFTDEA